MFIVVDGVDYVYYFVIDVGMCLYLLGVVGVGFGEFDGVYFGFWSGLGDL